MAEAWCGYIDMLATRSIARRSAQDLHEYLDGFHSALDSAFEKFESGNCYAFSDGAFFTCSSFDSFAAFFKLVRNELFQAGNFFRCSLIEGSIRMVERKEGRNASGERRFVSMTFVEDAPKAYQKESEFKGVGCIVDIRPSAAAKYPALVRSFYVVPNGSKTSAIETVDFRFSPDELARPDGHPSASPGSRRVFDPIVSGCHASITQSEYVAAYYVTPLVTAIRSTDLRDLDFADGAWVSAPYVFDELLSGGVARALRSMPGVHLLLLATFDHLYTQKASNIPDAVEAEVLARLTSFPQCFRHLNTVPEFVISQRARERLINLKIVEERRASSNRRIKRPKVAK